MRKQAYVWPSVCMFVWRLLQLTVKSLRDPGVQLSHAIDRLVGMDGMDKPCAPLKSPKNVRKGKAENGEKWQKHKGRRSPSTDGLKLFKHLLWIYWLPINLWLLQNAVQTPFPHI